jgi:hypothetical protein
MVIKRFDPLLLGNGDAFRLAACEHGSSRLGLGFSVKISSGIVGNVASALSGKIRVR